MSYQKKDGRDHARPSFFWYDNNSGHKGPFRVTPLNRLVIQYDIDVPTTGNIHKEMYAYGGGCWVCDAKVNPNKHTVAKGRKLTL